MKQNISYYQNIKPQPKHAGFSDIRMWPCYMVLCLGALLAAQLMGLLLSFLLVGLPLFALAMILARLTDVDASPIYEESVYAAIEARVEAYEKEHQLLRRNTKIIQEDEVAAKQSKDVGISSRAGSRAVLM